MDPDLQGCLKNGRLVKVRPDRRMVKKELETAGYDLRRARGSLASRDAKWGTIQGYYAMFHAAKALLYAKGYREKSHRCLLIGLRELYAASLGEAMVRSFEEAMDLREEADYEASFSESSAEDVLESAAAFLEKAKALCKRTGRRAQKGAGLKKWLG